MTKKDTYSLTSVITAAWNTMLYASRDIDILMKCQDAYVPLRMTVECKVEINPGNETSPMAYEFGVLRDHNPTVKIEFPSVFELEKGLFAQEGEGGRRE